MKKTFVCGFLCVVLFIGSARADPISLICTGSLTLKGHASTDISGETALLNIDESSFKPPLYNSFPLIAVRNTDISFGSESPTLSVFGNLDRISGTLSMTVMEPSERKRLGQGATVHFLALMSAKCSPAQRLF